MRRLPLSGIVVAELGARIGAAVCGALLAQLGATIVVPERRGWATPKGRHRDQLIAGKLSIVIGDDAAAEGELLGKIIAQSDVLLLSSDMEPLGQSIQYPADADRIDCNVTAFGDSGPLAGQPFSDAQIQAVSGILDTTGIAAGPPSPIRLPIVEFMTGVYAAAACLAALRVRRAGGGGQKIDMALYDCAFVGMSTFLPTLLSGSKPTISRIGNRHSMTAPWNVYRARNGWVQLCAASDLQWTRICTAVGRPELANDPRYGRASDRAHRTDEVDAVLQAWIGRETVEACVSTFGLVDIPCGPVAEVDKYPREQNLDYRKSIRRVRDGMGMRDIFIPASPMRMGALPDLTLEEIPAPDSGRAAILHLMANHRGSKGAPTEKTKPRLPLTGLRVIEIGHYTTAPLGARHLANLGAEVIKIEPAEGEAVRNWPPVRSGKSYFFTLTNSDKLSVTLDMNSPEGVAHLRQLIVTADVLIENLKPGALAKRGFSVAEIEKINPRLIYCAVSGFGANSKYAGRPAYDTVIQAMSGVMNLTRAGDVPVKTGISSVDLLGAEIAVVTILGALEYREIYGAGQSIDLSMQDIGAWVTMPLWNDDQSAPCPTVIAAEDGYVVVEAPAGQIGPMLSRLAAVPSASRKEVAAGVAGLGYVSAPILSAREMLDSEQTRERGLIIRAKDSDGEEWPLLASPFRLKGTPPEMGRIMGPLGNDNSRVLGSPADIPPTHNSMAVQ